VTDDNPTPDEKVFDLILLTIGALIGVAVAIFAFSSELGSNRQDAMNREDPAFQAAVLERIEPYGRAVLDGQTDPAEDVAPPVDEPEEVAVMLSGPQVYNQACTACHSTGAGGAPKVGDVVEWGPRIGTGMAALNDHAINGFQGLAGFMPAKGGAIQLADDEVIGAVQYMVDQSK
jgi:cytochrome c5